MKWFTQLKSQSIQNIAKDATVVKKEEQVDPLQKLVTCPSCKHQFDDTKIVEAGMGYVKCPKCGSPLVMVVTRFGKKMKKCSTNTWNRETKKAEGCDYVEWINGTTEALDEACPECGKPLVLYTTAAGKKMKKCSTSGWDREKKVATGCTYVQWLKPGEYPVSQGSNGEEFLPPEPPDAEDA